MGSKGLRDRSILPINGHPQLGYAHPTRGFLAGLMCGPLFDLRVALRGFDVFRPGAPMQVVPHEEWFVTRAPPVLRPDRA
ncbi:hypothetical protein [Roseomonas sp. HF4]|uniref:hypothetical protein n=1 Tax=Roseomonas sp. HF4 TaxID=2562313 RepID=UPI0010C121D0|nr:hypothetical protein [Roseomonas sp. HF4]